VTEPDAGTPQPVTRDTLILDLIERYPGAAAYLASRFGGDCATCVASEVETLAEAARLHGIDIDALMSDVHARIESWDARPAESDDPGAGGDAGA
jgi:hybrid cluster-associated redox disulfide protein